MQTQGKCLFKIVNEELHICLFVCFYKKNLWEKVSIKQIVCSEQQFCNFKDLYNYFVVAVGKGKIMYKTEYID